ncbi:MAG: serine--tRNA ligase [Myxococcota bacterium]|jgi:seryl-tRNA synthetase|nr:serine--tRNA ligase [Myxococcota bacterium]
MLDPRLVADQPDLVRGHLERRYAGPEILGDLDRVTQVIVRRRAVQSEGDQLRADRKRLSKQVGQLMREGRTEEAEAAKAQVRTGADALQRLEQEERALEGEQRTLLMGLPNLLDDAVPPGKSDTDNVLVRTWGEVREMDFEPLSHDELGARLGILDAERAAKLSGARFAVLHGSAARIERALVNYFLDRATRTNGYREVMVPYMVSRTTMEGTGQLPKFEDDAFRISDPVNGQDAFLVPTAEVPVTNLHRDEILSEDQLPLSYACFTPCFRAEAGSYGKDTRGLIRQHQFHKVEMVKITTPEQSPSAHEALTGHAQGLLEELGLPYRTVRLCAGDISANARLCMDLEVWLPSQATYREISSCSNFGDFQARRMALRYRPAGGGKARLCHTINGSGLAVGRTLVAILENYQQADGTVVVPEALRPFADGLDRITGEE